MDVHGFNWDEGNLDKCQKHGLTIEDIESLFHSRPLIGPDLKHSDEETRFQAVGRTTVGRPVIVTFTWRISGPERLIRPVSARYMHQKEVEAYESAVSASQE